MKTKTWVVLIACLLILCAAGSIWVLAPREAASHAQITSDGKVVATLDLTREDSLRVEFKDGYNILTVQDGKIAVTEASCPDHYCMKRGFLNSGTDIVCLPNRLVISFLGDTAVIDAAVG